MGRPFTPFIVEFWSEGRTPPYSTPFNKHACPKRTMCIGCGSTEQNGEKIESQYSTQGMIHPFFCPSAHIGGGRWKCPSNGVAAYRAKRLSHLVFSVAPCRAQLGSLIPLCSCSSANPRLLHSHSSFHHASSSATASSSWSYSNWVFVLLRGPSPTICSLRFLSFLLFLVLLNFVCPPFLDCCHASKP